MGDEQGSVGVFKPANCEFTFKTPLKKKELDSGGRRRKKGASSSSEA